MPGLRILTSYPTRKKLLLSVLFIFLPADGAIIVSGLSNLWILGIAALSAMLLAWLLGTFTVVAPINRLVASAQLLGRGELGTRTGLPHTPDELGQLAKSFDEMASLLEMRSIEYKRAEQALKESEVRYRTLFESATVAIFLILDNKFIDCNDAALKMYGYTREELIGNYPYAISPPVQPNGKDSKEEAIKRMAGVFSGVPQFFEWRHCRRDGTQFDAEVSLDPMELGNEILILGIIRDITSRKAAEKALHESAWFQQQLIDALPAPVFFKDPEGRYLGCNKAYESFLNMGKDQIIGKSVFEIAPEELAALYQEKDLALLRNPGVQIYESSVRDADGSVHNVVFHKATFSKADGSVGGVVGAILDITARKRAEEDLRASEERYRLIFNHAPLGIIHFDRMGVVQDLNDKFAEIIGTAKEEIPGFNMLERLRDPAFLQAVKDAIEGGFGHYEGDYLSILGGKTTPMRAIYRRINAEDGKFLGGVGIFEDITDRKNAEKVLRESENRYRTIFENTGTATVIFEEDTIISLANAEFEKLTGYTRDEIENKKSWTEFVVKEDLETLLDRHRQWVADGKAALKQYEFRLIDRHGRTKYCLLTIDMIADTKRRVASLLDISERKKAEEELISANRQLNDIVEFLPDATFVVDKDKKVIAWNRAIEDMTGVSKKEMIGKGDHAYTVPFYGDRRPNLADLIDARDGELESRYQYVTRKNGILSAETYVPCVYGGQGAYVFATCAPLFDAHGNRVGAIESIRNVTERRQVLEALRHSEEKYRELVENANSIILRMDNMGSVTFFNEFAQNFFGYSEEEILGKNVVGTIVPEVESTTGRELRLMIEDIAVNPHRYASNINENMRRDGDRVWVAWTNKPILDANGRVVEVLCVGNDITERKWAVEALQESEARLKIAMDIAKLVQWEYDVKSGMFSFDEQFYALYGTTSQQEGGSLMTAEAYARKFLPPEESHVVAEEIARALATTDPDFTRQLEHGIIRADGEERHIVVRYGVICDQTGRVVKTRGVNQDITERKQAEEALKRANILLFTQKETSIDGILAVNENDTIILSNQRFADMWGISCELVEAQVDAPVLRSVSDKVRDPQAFLQRVGYLYAHRNETSLEELALKDGRTFERYSAPMNGTDGRYYGRVWYFRDITERKRMEEAVAEAEAKYRGIFENSVMGIFQSTLGRILSLNTAAARILGYDSPEEVLNSVTDLNRHLYVDPDRRSELLRLIKERGMAQEFEVQLFRKDKSAAWISLNIRAVHDGNGKIIRMEGTAQDITESKRLTSLLNQAQKMEAIGTLAGGIAHDFNNILMPIIGYSELSLNAVPKGSRLHHNIEQILLSGNRASELVKQILTFSRKTEQERRPVQVSLLVKETLKMLRSTLPSTIRIRRDIDEGAIYATTMADPTEIHQVLMNLCTNAAHAMREKGGVLSINLKNVDIDSAAISEVPDLAPGPYLRLTVADTGHGMDEAVRQRIFDPYFTTKGPAEGTGLGLALVYGIITSLSGGISVFSEPGQGATFAVYFPRTKTLQAPMVEASEPLPTGKGLVLVVDDEQPIVDMLKEMLVSLGYDVAERYSSYDALQAFRARPGSFDLVITDLTMPHMTGIDLAREILKTRRDIPIILCTGFSDTVDENRTKLLGIKGFLMKPIALRDLAVTASKILVQDNPIT
ncbi:MAG: PAS domain S-box protein [Syntrophobacteraceae bacterium]